MVYLPALLELNLQLSDEQFFQLCQQHRDLKFERTANGELTIMSPTGGMTSNRNAELIYQLMAWNRSTKLGKVFDSSGGFKLPNGANRSPDASWVRRERWNALTAEEQAKFVPLCPDMVVELRSPSDDLSKLQAKMQEYRENGAELGWLIDPERQIVEIYRPHREPEILSSPKTLSGETILPDFELDLTGIL
ncbi:Uma2 family endonuclease [Oxynema aestuarii]|jgi:Uma2 family endonuclease|uniref:Uma2 family endonuclease n=1 Tax=Oxynema aestuarii AP17 TaxID=2064643 RepID=A0A6H1TWW1_9CYAN|nr:Uma2 family endonuclease [Oxynema aestuarii]QIZ71084.1 Uma2 family endonuclease [Oxynema aestuarii AP17]